MDYETGIMLEARLKQIEKSLDAQTTQQYSANILKALEIRLYIKTNFDDLEIQEKYLNALGAIELG